MVIYEVTAEVGPDLAPAYERYMRETHVREVVRKGSFAGASFMRTVGSRFRVQYEVADQLTLDRYLTEYAPALRADFAREIPSGISLSREVWSVVQRW